MKPHEEEWVLDASDPESAPIISLKDGGVLFDCNDAQRGALAVAAPNMARALVRYRMQHGENCNCDACNLMRMALFKAGVLQ